MPKKLFTVYISVLLTVIIPVSATFSDRDVLLSLIPQVQAEVQSEVLYDRAMRLIDKGKEREATVLLQQVLAKTEDTVRAGAEHVGEISGELAFLYISMGELKKAEIYLRKAIGIFKGLYGTEDSNVIALTEELVDLKQIQKLEDPVSFGMSEDAVNRPPESSREEYFEAFGDSEGMQLKGIHPPSADIITGKHRPLSMHDGSVHQQAETHDQVPLHVEDNVTFDSPLATETKGPSYNPQGSFSCIDPSEYNSDWGRKAMEQVLKGTKGTYEKSAKSVLIKLYKEKGLGLKPIHIQKIVSNFGVLIRAADGLSAWAAGDYSSAMDNLGKGALTYGAGLTGVPLFGEIIMAAEVVQLSYRELQEQEDRLNMDLAFYNFMDDKLLQSELKKDPKYAVEYYTAAYIAARPKHRKLVQAYLDVELKGKFDSMLDTENLYEILTNESESKRKATLHSAVLTMLRDFERRHREFKKATQRAINRRNDPLVKFLRTALRTYADLPIAYDAFKEWCDIYDQFKDHEDKKARMSVSAKKYSPQKTYTLCYLVSQPADQYKNGPWCGQWWGYAGTATGDGVAALIQKKRKEHIAYVKKNNKIFWWNPDIKTKVIEVGGSCPATVVCK